MQLTSNKTQLDTFAPVIAFEEWQPRQSGPTIPLSVADAVAAKPQEPGLPPGPSASASAPAAAAAEPGEGSEYEEAVNEPKITGRWLRRAGQTKWRICGVHMHRHHANTRRQHGRTTAADLLGLALRDKADAITGDWNQAG